MGAQACEVGAGGKDMMGSEQESSQSASELLGQAIDQSKRLAQAEFEAARQELREDARDALKGLALLGAGAGLGLGGAIALSVALALALRTRPTSITLLVGLGMLAGAATLTLQGARALPKRPMARAMKQVQKDVELVREQLT